MTKLGSSFLRMVSAVLLLTSCCVALANPNFLQGREEEIEIPNFPVVCHNQTVLVDVALTFQPREPDNTIINILPLLWEALQSQGKELTKSFNYTLGGVPESRLGLSMITPQAEGESCQFVLSSLTKEPSDLVRDFRTYKLRSLSSVPLNTWGAIQQVATDSNMKWRKQDPNGPPVVKLIFVLTSTFDEPGDGTASSRTCGGKPYPTLQEVAETLRNENIHLAMLVDPLYMARWKKTLDTTDIKYLLGLYNYSVIQTSFLEDVMRFTQETVCQLHLPSTH